MMASRLAIPSMIRSLRATEMGDAYIVLPEDKGRLSLVQAYELMRLLDIAGDDAHWHPNTCGCCVTMHGPDYAYVISDDGESTFFAERGCDC